jgi:hypothetical protein
MDELLESVTALAEGTNAGSTILKKPLVLLPGLGVVFWESVMSG